MANTKIKTVARVTLPASQKGAPKNAKLAAAKLSPAERVEITVQIAYRTEEHRLVVGSTNDQ